MLREWIDRLMESHEAIVHFPIVLLTTSFIFGVMGTLYKRALFRELVFWNLFFGLLTLGGAMITGFSKETVSDDPMLIESIDIHRRNAWIMTSFIFFLSIWLGWRKRKMKGQEYIAWLAVFFIASSSAIYQGQNGYEVRMMKSKPKKPLVPYERKELDYGWNF